jgi:hypothetical protein
MVINDSGNLWTSPREETAIFIFIFIFFKKKKPRYLDTPQCDLTSLTQP